MHRYLALGDSYTIGEGVAPRERWPERLVELLRGAGIRVEAPQIIAKTGWTTGELSDAIDAADPRGPYDLVSLLIGVNNQYRGLLLDEYASELDELLRRAIAFTDGRPERVIVLSIPDWGVTRFAADRDRAAIARDIDAFNAVKRDAVVQHGARYVDITPTSRAAGDADWALAEDGLHPSGAAYEEWARLALPAAVSALREESA
jgi:lysophospholipase L1-like esterase